MNTNPKRNVGSLKLFPKTKFPGGFDFKVILDVVGHTPMPWGIAPEGMMESGLFEINPGPLKNRPGIPSATAFDLGT